jgi:hypothetical protein
MIGMIVALLIATSPAAAADDDYGEALCKKYMPPGTPCTCVGPILDEDSTRRSLSPCCGS